MSYFFGFTAPYLDTDANNIINNMSPMPNRQIQDSINNLILSIKSSGTYSKLSGLYIMGGGLGAGPSLLNWADGGATSLTARNSPSLSLQGYAGNGTNSDLLGPLWSVIEAAGYAQNDASAGVWTGADVVDATFPMATNASGQAFLINGPGVSHLGVIRPNNTTGTSNFHSWFSGKMLTAFSRTAAGTYNLYVNNQKYVTTLASNGVPAGTNHLTFLSAAGTTFSTKTVTAGWVGKSLTDDQISSLVQAVNTYLQALAAFDATSWYPDGVWTWFNNPRVLPISGHSTLIGGIDSSGNVFSAQKIDSNSFIYNKNIFTPQQIVDDHSNWAALTRASDSKALLFFSPHGVTSSTNYYLLVSDNAVDGNVTFSGGSTNIGTQMAAGGVNTFSYANPYELTTPGMINFFRAQSPGFYTQHFSTSADGGTTWTAATRLLWDGRPYLISNKTGADRLDMAVSTCNPTDGIFAYNNIYHIVYSGGAFTASDGASIGSLPYTQATLEATKSLVFDSQAAGVLAWHWDVVRDAGDKPVVCYARFPVTSPVGQDHEYYQARFNGTSWVSNLVCAAGGNIYPSNNQTGGTAQNYYSGGLVSDPTNVNTIYCSRQVDNNGNISTSGIFQIFKAVTSDSGVTWTLTQLTNASNHCFRPYLHPNGDRTLYYCTGAYTGYTVYSGVAIASMTIT